MRRVVMAVAGMLLCCFCQHLQAQRALQRVYSGAVGGYLIEGTDGFFYGSDASSSNLFKFRPDGTYRSLGRLPSLNAEITLADDGNIYGTTRKGGTGYGSIFQIAPGGQVTEVYSFSPPTVGPAGLRKGVDGALYGVTGSATPGHFLPEPTTIFQFTTNGTFTTLYATTNAGAGFNSSPVQGPDGTLYGTEEYSSGFNSGTAIYQLPPGGAHSVLYRMTNATSSDGLIFGPDGALYGTIGDRYPTQGGIFRITTNGQFSQIFTFAQTNGASPAARLLLASDSTFTAPPALAASAIQEPFSASTPSAISRSWPTSPMATTTVPTPPSSKRPMATSTARPHRSPSASFNLPPRSSSSDHRL